MSTPPIVFVFNAPLSSGCDYVTQTMRIVARTNPTYGIALGDIISFPRWLAGKDRWVVKNEHGATVVRPISILPGIRFRWVRILTYSYVSVILRVWLAIKYKGVRKLLWFFEPFHVPPLLTIFLGYTTVYDCVDYYPGLIRTPNMNMTV